jgi:hypothetical protein
MHRTFQLFATTVLLLSTTALAQREAAPTKDKAQETFDEVERGLFVGVQLGPFFMLNPPASPGPGQTTAVRNLSPGQMAQLELGFDFGDLFSVSAFLTGSANRAGKDYIGESGGLYSGDFWTLVPGAAVRFNIIGFDDSQQTRRLFLYARAGAGYALFSPRQLLPDPDIPPGPAWSTTRACATSRLEWRSPDPTW